MTKKQYEPAVAALHDAHSICIVTHLRPDADAIGSAAALLLALRQRGKDVCAVVGQEREISRNLYTIPPPTTSPLALSCRKAMTSTSPLIVVLWTERGSLRIGLNS